MSLFPNNNYHFCTRLLLLRYGKYRDVPKERTYVKSP